LDNFHHLDWRCINIFFFLNLHSPHPSPSYAVFRVKLWVNSSTIHFPMSTQLAVVEKFHMDSTRISCHTLPLQVPLCMLLDWMSLLTFNFCKQSGLQNMSCFFQQNASQWNLFLQCEHVSSYQQIYMIWSLFL
jgi:hypothetical protein